jgi:hypothetical protein
MNKSVQSEDGLSLYSLSNSFCIPGAINSFDIQNALNLLKNSSSSSSDEKTLKPEQNKVLKKSSATDQTDKATPNNALDDSELSNTIKPGNKHPTSINIKMDCYDELRTEGEQLSSETTFGDDDGTDEVILRKKSKGSTAIKRRSGNRR